MLTAPSLWSILIAVSVIYLFLVAVNIWRRDWSVVVLATLFIIWLWYFSIPYLWTEQSPTQKSKEINMSDDEEESDPKDSLHLGKYTALDRDLYLGDKNQGEVLEKITYVKFKELIEDKDFISRFTSSLQTGMKYKRKLYKKLWKQIKMELDTLKSKGEEDPFANMLKKLRNEQEQTSRETLKHIESIIEDIGLRLKDLTTVQVAKNLHTAVYDKEVGMESMLGREDIKDFLSARLYAYASNPRVFYNSFQNMAIYSPPGSGKTKMATVIGNVYGISGILIKGNVIITTKTSLISPYVEETAHKTKSFLLSTLESVVFIDEAYDITPKDPFSLKVSHGKDAVTEMVNFIDKFMGLNIIIVAGYEEQMREQFMKSNEGLARRFPHEMVLKPYTSQELTSILLVFINKTNPSLVISKENSNYIYTLIKWLGRYHPQAFSNQAGDMLNLAGEISGAVYSTFNSWPKDAETVIRVGFNNFLSKHNISISENVKVEEV
jgi:hypothetical protein